MSTEKSPPEGSIFILSYTECDYENEDTAALVYILQEGRLQPPLGVGNLPDGASFNIHNSDNYDSAFSIVRKQNVD